MKWSGGRRRDGKTSSSVQIGQGSAGGGDGGGGGNGVQHNDDNEDDGVWDGIGNRIVGAHPKKTADVLFNCLSGVVHTTRFVPKNLPTSTKPPRPTKMIKKRPFCTKTSPFV